MGESVILQLPLALVLYSIALFLNLFERHYRATKGIFIIVAAVISIATTAYSLIMGADFWEGATVLLVFLLLNMG